MSTSTAIQIVSSRIYGPCNKTVAEEKYSVVVFTYMGHGPIQSPKRNTTSWFSRIWTMDQYSLAREIHRSGYQVYGSWTNTIVQERYGLWLLCVLRITL